MVQINKWFVISTIFAGALALTGCISSTNVSRVSPFSLYVGKTFRLERPVGIEKPGTLNQLSRVDCVLEDLPAKSPSSRAHRTEDKHEPGGVDRLAAGHVVVIDRVVDEVAFDNEAIIAYGHTAIGPSGNVEARFAYMWGFVWVLRPAPWEPGTVPLRRYPPFKLPPHFDYPIFAHGKLGEPMWGTPDPNAKLPRDM